MTLAALMAGFAYATPAGDAVELTYSSNITSTSYNGGEYSGVQFNIQGALDVNLLQLEGESPLEALPSVVTLNSLTIKSRPNNTTASTVYAALLDDEGKILTLSNNSSRASNGANYSFTFDSYEISTTTTYSVALLSSKDGLTTGSVLSTNKANAQLAAWGGNLMATNTANLGLLKKNDYSTQESTGYIPDITLGITAATPAVPEPATATLSLLTLVGLATRRRRA